MSEPDFWKDQEAAQKLLQRRRRLEEDKDLSDSLKRRADDLAVLVEWAEAGEPVADDLARALDELQVQVDAGETKKMLGGEHDRKNAIITIHPGAGGTESQDWAEMLLRMYLRWTERRNFKREVIDVQPGDEAGIKGATLTVIGDYAYGMLLAEAGVHFGRQLVERPAQFIGHRLARFRPLDEHLQVLAAASQRLAESAVLLEAAAALQQLLGACLIFPEIRRGDAFFYLGEFLFGAGGVKDSSAGRRRGAPGLRTCEAGRRFR